VVTSDLSAPFSKLRDQKSRKRCHDKLHSTLDLWPNIRLHGIRLPVSRSMASGPTATGSSALVALAAICSCQSEWQTQEKKNQGTTWIRHRSLRMINSIESCLYGCRVWYGGWITRWRPVNNHHQEGRHGSKRMKPFTPWRGMVTPRWWGYTCLGFGS